MKMIKIMNRGRCALLVAVFCLIGLVSGCSNGPTTTYSYSPPTTADGKVCVDECEQSKTICSRLCQRVDPVCLENAQKQAEFDYQNYVNEQTEKQAPVSRTVHSFYHAEQCAHTGCGCESEYKVCYQLCGTRTEAHNAILARE